MFTDENMTAKEELFAWLRHMNKNKGSDLFVTTHFPPAMKLDGKITRITDEPLTAEKCMEIAFSIMSAKQAEEFSSTNECNFAISLPDTSRFRVNAMIQRGATALVFRAITSKIPKFESLNLPPALKDVALKKRGLAAPARANRLRSPRLSTTAMKIRSDTSSPSKIRSSLSTNTKTASLPSARSAWTRKTGWRR